ncbi:rhamnulokinase family protein [Arthrobacter sp. SW1]|uniref:rhamnulokinase n=1 Tax=Arthrobacter sp. SW1 TaxID=1920889 RepID=UPI0009F30ACD|nr:rhamnulokinase family protein [Arthrobacter sp. SW1]
MSSHIPGDGSGAVFAAVDIGASSGRVMLGRVSATGVSLETVHRFPNGVVELDGGLRWDFGFLFDEVLKGLADAASVAAAAGERIASIGIDTWAVDYGLLEDSGGLVSMPYSYRDSRGSTAVERVHALVDERRLYGITGLQFLPFNTLYQLASEPSLDGVQALLIPDLIAFMLTGERRTEATNASTTGLFDAVAGEWATGLMDELGLPPAIFPPLVEPGDTIGTLLPDVAARIGLPASAPVVAVGSHDTASAVAAVPAVEDGFAYISSGTWSLVGVELDRPVLDEASRAANFTNERGVDGTVRYLRNVGGLWLLSECQRAWAGDGHEVQLGTLLDEAAALPPGGPVIDADDPAFTPPGGMPERIREAVRRAGGQAPEAPAAVVRCILDSLAAGYARTLRRAAELAGKRIKVVHVVGGGSQNSLLCQLTADACGLPVVAGPVEATAQGNILIQARAAGAVSGSLEQLRRFTAPQQAAVRYEPRATAAGMRPYADPAAPAPVSVPVPTGS